MYLEGLQSLSAKLSWSRLRQSGGDSAAPRLVFHKQPKQQQKQCQKSKVPQGPGGMQQNPLSCSHKVAGTDPGHSFGVPEDSGSGAAAAKRPPSAARALSR